MASIITCEWRGWSKCLAQSQIIYCGDVKHQNFVVKPHAPRPILFPLEGRIKLSNLNIYFKTTTVQYIHDHALFKKLQCDRKYKNILQHKWKDILMTGIHIPLQIEFDKLKYMSNSQNHVGIKY